VRVKITGQGHVSHGSGSLGKVMSYSVAGTEVVGFRLHWFHCLVTSDKGGGTRFFPRLSVCLSVSKITQKRVHGFGLNAAC